MTTRRLIVGAIGNAIRPCNLAKLLPELVSYS